MAFRQFTLTLNGAAQRLSRVYASGAADAQPSATDDIPYRQILFAADPANTAVVYIGSASTVLSTAHAFSLDPTQASQFPVSLGPFEAGPLKLSDFWVLGTNNERLMIGGVPF